MNSKLYGTHNCYHDKHTGLSRVITDEDMELIEKAGRE